VKKDRAAGVVPTSRPATGVNPALDRFTDLARQQSREAEEQARRHGRELGAAVATAPAEGRLKPARVFHPPPGPARRSGRSGAA